MSTGTQRKLALAAALVSHCAVVLLDEPLNALDSKSLAELRDGLRDGLADGLLAAQGGAHEALSHQPRQAWLVASHEPPLPATPLRELLLDTRPARPDAVLRSGAGKFTACAQRLAQLQLAADAQALEDHAQVVVDGGTGQA